MPRARSVSHPTLVPLGQPEKAMGHESQIEPWLAPDNRVLLVGLRTDWLRRKEAMKTTGRETHNRYTTPRGIPRSRSGSREQSCLMGTGWAATKLRPQVKCVFLDSLYRTTQELQDLSVESIYGVCQLVV